MLALTPVGVDPWRMSVTYEERNKKPRHPSPEARRVDFVKSVWYLYSRVWAGFTAQPWSYTLQLD
jgi:hypothetical protein